MSGNCATGIAVNRLHQILAVLEKHMGLPLSRFDCYLAVAGGLEVEEPAADLGVAAAVVASYRDLTLPPGTVLIGELGLGGQLRPVSQLELRLGEAARLGCAVADVVLAWTAEQPGITSVLFGATDPDQVRTNAAALA